VLRHALGVLHCRARSAVLHTLRSSMALHPHWHAALPSLHRTLLAVKARLAAAQDTQGFPRVERDLLQVEQYSQELKAKAARIDPSGDALAATRLLAQEGLNTRKRGPPARAESRPCDAHHAT